MIPDKRFAIVLTEIQLNTWLLFWVLRSKSATFCGFVFLVSVENQKLCLIQRSASLLDFGTLKSWLYTGYIGYTGYIPVIYWLHGYVKTSTFIKKKLLMTLEIYFIGQFISLGG